jgi:predicted ATP-dependent Lon-type protease
MVSLGFRFVIRLAHDRLVEEDEAHRLFEFMSTSKPVDCERTVELSRRKASLYLKAAKIHPARDFRVAKLSITASEVKFKKGGRADKTLPSTLTVNVVRVFEKNPPKGEKPIQWFLATTEPIETMEQILNIVDYYRKRWLIEEFFKALKTGCRLEDRLLESAESWHKVLVMFLPIAANLLNLRELKANELEKSNIFSHAEIKILKIQARKYKMPIKTVEDAKMVIARIGGYANRQWPPGWIILGRGYDDLRAWAKGYQLAENPYLC